MNKNLLDKVVAVKNNTLANEAEKEFFATLADYILLLDDNYEFIKNGGLKTALVDELAKRNKALYEEILPANYETSYGNPAYAVKRLPKEVGQNLSSIHSRVHSLIKYVYAQNLEMLEEEYAFFIECYEACANKAEDEINGELVTLTKAHVNKMAAKVATNEINEMVVAEGNRYVDIITNSDLNDIRYLYAYGKYITENEIETSKYLANLPEETIATMADTYTEGYRIGFEVTGKDLSKKTTAEVYYHVGFERMLRRAVSNFAKIGLKTTARWICVDGGAANKQYDYDHKDDIALILDEAFVDTRIKSREDAFEAVKEAARGYAGPAVVETFGEADFDPVNKPERITMPEKLNGLYVSLISRNGEVTRKYIIPEERSFTIIAFPVPEVGEVFKELFDETIKLNTLDYILYRDVQQTIIDALDTADYCLVKGCGANKTDLKVNLYKLKDAAKETIFENCVADVNIPVGEVFTSPVLEGTNGKLHVTKVFLNGLEYRDLEIDFKEGMIDKYTCKNFATEEENVNFVKDNILFRHDTLPIGEFAIGTNTTAYVMARRLGVEAKMPILIAEKTGPHFAVGDTCYSHSEDTAVYNPDGKEIVARDNSKSILRKSDPTKAYYNCHTDITIPYDELGELSAVAKDGTKIVIIKDGKFVLPGTEVLNEPFLK